jgi:hypothetical protein
MKGHAASPSLAIAATGFLSHSQSSLGHRRHIGDLHVAAALTLVGAAMVPHVLCNFGRPAAHAYDHVSILDSGRTFGKATAAYAPAGLVEKLDQSQQYTVAEHADGGERIVEAPVPGT